MVIAKDNPKGLDALINRIQKSLDSGLSSIWDADVNIYPRCYNSLKTLDGNQTYRTIEYYQGGGEYKDIVSAEENKIFFVKTGDVVPKNLQQYQTEIEMYVSVNLEEVLPDINHRADEEARNGVLGILKTLPQVEVLRLVTEIQKVYNGFRFRENDDDQPYHCFKVELRVYYGLNDKACNN